MYTGVCSSTWRKWLRTKVIPGRKNHLGEWQIDMITMFNKKKDKWHDYALLLLDNLTELESIQMVGDDVQVIIRAKSF